MNRIKQLLKKFEKFIKFAIVGCSNTVINLCIYYLLVYVGVNYNIAYCVAFVVSVSNAFFWNNKVVFTNKKETHMMRAFVKVFASYSISFVLSLAFMNIMVEWLKISFYVAPIIKLVLTIPLNYFLNKIWAFKEEF